MKKLTPTAEGKIKKNTPNIDKTGVIENDDPTLTPTDDGWVEMFTKEFDEDYLCCGGDFCDYQQHTDELNEIKSFIRSTIAHAKEEERKRCIEAIKNHAEDVGWDPRATVNILNALKEDA